MTDRLDTHHDEITEAPPSELLPEQFERSDGTTDIGPLSYSNTGVNGWWVRLVAWTLVAICAVLVYLLTRSPWGRLLRGIREDEDAIRSLGKNVFAIKMQALIIGGLQMSARRIRAPPFDHSLLRS